MVIYAMSKKGLAVLSEVVAKHRELLKFVVVERDVAVENDFYNQIVSLLESEGVSFYRRGSEPDLDRTDYVLAISWRWMISHHPDHLIVFHDSLLPRYRGFAPLVSMLVNKESQLGVTALFGSNEYDTGAIISQAKVSIEYPITIAEAIESIIPCYISLVSGVCNAIKSGIQITGEPQLHDEATYSLWRDADDYQIDWTLSAEYIKRFIDSVGFPYGGARTETSCGRRIRVDKASTVRDVICEQRQVGKVLFLRNGHPVVVCGEGLLRIDAAFEVDSEQSILPLTKFRTRFGIGK